MPVSDVEKSADQVMIDEGYVQQEPVSILDVIEAHVAVYCDDEALKDITGKIDNQKPPKFIEELLTSLEITSRTKTETGVPAFKEITDKKFDRSAARKMITAVLWLRLDKFQQRPKKETVELPPDGKTVQIVKTVKTGVLCTGNAWIPFGSFDKDLKTGDEIIVVPAPDLQNKDKDRVLREAYRQWQG